jgi:hypothetical protein
LKCNHPGREEPRHAILLPGLRAVLVERRAAHPSQLVGREGLDQVAGVPLHPDALAARSSPRFVGAESLNQGAPTGSAKIDAARTILRTGRERRHEKGLVDWDQPWILLGMPSLNTEHQLMRGFPF